MIFAVLKFQFINRF